MITNPQFLKYFLVMANTQNISRAAERLAIAQPALTKALQKLEHDLGRKLFERTRKGLTLTPSGERLVLEADKILQQWESLKENIAKEEDEIRGLVKIGCHPLVGSYSLPIPLKILLTENPELTVDIKTDLSRNITSRVISGELDIGIVVNPIAHNDLIIKNVTKDQVHFWSIAESDFNTIIYDPMILQSQVMLKKLQLVQKKSVSLLACENLELVRQLTLAGIGIGILPTRVAKIASSTKLKKQWEQIYFADQISVVIRVENKNIQKIKTLVTAFSDFLKGSSH